MALIPKNLHEIPQFIEKYKTFGFDSIEFGYDYKLPIQMKLRPVKTKLLRENIQKALKASIDLQKIDTLRLELLGLL